MKKGLLTLLGLILIGVDQWTKFWVVDNIALAEVKPFFPPIFSLTYLQNRGAAFSMLQDQQWFFILTTVIFLVVAVRYFIKSPDKSPSLIPLTLIVAGGIGNFIDRLRLGYVVDMVHLDFMDFAIFNVADSYLTVGVALMAVALWLEEKDDRTTH